MFTDMNPVKRLLWDIITSGGFEKYDLEAKRKTILINILCVISIVNLIPLGIIAFVKKNPVLGLFDLALASTLIFIVAYLRKRKYHDFVSYLGISVAGALFLYLFVTGGVNNTGYLWYYCFPLFSIFLLGSKRGAIAVLVVFIPAFLLLTVGSSPLITAIYTTDFKVRFIPSFLVVFGFSYFFEKIREGTQQLLAQKNAELGETINILTQAQKALRRSEEKYRNLFDTAMVGMYRTAMEDGKVIEANIAFANILGYGTVEELKREFVTSKGYENSERREALMEMLKMSGSVDRFEIEGFRKDGARVSVEVSGTLHPNEGYIEGFIVDNTERKLAEMALSESEEKYRSMMESMVDPTYICSPDLRVEFMNPSMIRRTGYDATGENCFKALHDFNEMCPWCEHYKSQQGEYYESEIVSPKDGRSYHVSNSPIVHGDGSISKMTVFRDTTDLKKLEAQLHRAQKMEAIGTLAGGVAHDLNNILGGLVSYPELLLLQLPEDSRLRESILTIQKSGEKAAAVVQDLLTLARRGVVVNEVVNLNSIIAQYLKSPEHERLQSYHPTVHAETHFEKDALNILGSSIHLSKTVMNLVSNAAEAMPEGGTLSISTENRYMDRPIRGYEHVKEGDYVVLTVSDTGTGISPDDIGKIFEPFYTKKKMGRSGTGLGMAVVWGTVKDHNGYIDCQERRRERNLIHPLFSRNPQRAG